VDELLVTFGQDCRQLTQVSRTIRNEFPALDRAVFEALTRLHERALRLLSDAVKRMNDEEHPQAK
jgi:hypothetical protein